MAKKMKTITKVILIVIVAILLFICSIAAMIFSRDPDFRKAELRQADTLTGMRYVWQVVGTAQRAENPEDTMRLVIASRDVPSLIRLAENGSDFLRIIGVNVLSINEKTFEEYSLNYTADNFEIQWRTYELICNLTVVVKAVGNIRYDGTCIDADLKKVQVGKINLSQNLVKKIERKIEQELMSRPEYRIFQEFIKSITVDASGNITIVYKPYKLNRVIKSFRA